MVVVHKAHFFVDRNGKGKFEYDKCYNNRPGMDGEQGTWFFYCDFDLKHGEWFRLEGIVEYLADPWVCDFSTLSDATTKKLRFMREVSKFAKDLTQEWHNDYTKLCVDALEYFGEQEWNPKTK